MEKVRVGLISRIDWGRAGFRKGLLDIAYQIVQNEKVHFIVIAGGLISWPALRKDWKEEVDSRLDKLKADAYEAEIPFNRHESKIEVEEDIIAEWAKEISRIIPRIKIGNRVIKTYLEISSAVNYDGPIGTRIATELTRLRQDIRFWGEGDVEFPLKQTGRVIRTIVPRKAAWRSKYFSTMVDRLVEDVEKQSAKRLPDVWVVGCSASAINRPQGDSRRPIISLPALHVLEEVSTSENAIGLRILDSYNGNLEVITYSFKDLVSQERSLISIPKDMGDDEKTIAEALKKGVMTIGLLADSTGISRKRTAIAIDNIRRNKKVPDVIFCSESGKYDFDGNWFQKKLVYPLPNESEYLEDSIVSFGCIHAGATASDYVFFVNDVPVIILERRAKILVGAGDFIEGLKHHLIERGEVYGGMIYSDQERLAATLVAKVIMQVFRARFIATSNALVADAVRKALLDFIYTDGNHDSWTQELGVRPLKTFRHVLIDVLAREIEIELQKNNLHVYGLRDIVKSKVVYVSQDNPVYILPSGISMAVIHPRMSRTKTSSIRAQEGLEKYRDNQVVVSANFHVAIIVEQWEEALGMRVAGQVGTIMRNTSYEDGHMKTLDFGVACLRIKSINKRILVSESCFVGKHSSAPTLDNRTIVNDLIRSLIGDKI